MNNNIIGQNIRKFRRQMGLSQNDLAKITNLSKRAIVYYEKEANNEVFSKLEIIANALNISLAELFKTSNTDNNSKIPEIDTRTIKKILNIKKLPIKDQNSIWEYIDFVVEKNKNKRVS